MASVFEIGGESAGELGGPGRGRVGGDAKRVDAAGLGLDDERDVEALQGDRAVHMEAVRGPDRLGVGAKERPPAVIVLAGRRNAVGTQEPADGRGADTVAEAAQFALDPDHVPGPVSRATRMMSAASSWLIGGRHAVVSPKSKTASDWVSAGTASNPVTDACASSRPDGAAVSVGIDCENVAAGAVVL